MTQAYRYHRFSTARQDKGTSIERQREATETLCKRKGWEIADTLEDLGRSAWKGDHLRVGELGRFRARVEAGEIETGSILVVENLDRLSRQEVKLARRWMEDITDAGILVAVCNPEMVVDADALSGNNLGPMITYIMEANRSTKESDRKSGFSQKMWADNLEKARKGIVFSARIPGWLRAEKNGSFEVIEERAEIVRQIYQWSADGIGVHAIARKLNELFEPWTKGHTKAVSTWKPGYVRDILLSPAVEGEYHVRTGPDRQYTGERIAYYPRIVPEELVANARAARLDRRGSGGSTRSEARNLFAGRVRCGHCGDTMVRTINHNKGRVYEYLKCVRFHNGGGWIEGNDEGNARRCRNSTLYRYDLFERAALHEILHLALDSTHFAKVDETGPLRARVAQLNKAVESKEAEQRRLLNFIMKQDDAPEAEAMLETIRPELTALKLERNEAQDALDRAKGHVSPEEHLRRVKGVQNAIYSDDPEEREQARRKVRDAIQSVVQVVQCRRDYVEGKRTPERQIIMSLAGGSLAFLFNGEGELLQKIDHTSNIEMFGLAGTGGEQAVRDIQRRKLSLKH